MSRVPTDINEYRKRLVQSEEQAAGWVDEEGVLWNRYIVDYTDARGTVMSMYVYATSEEDAADRLKAIAETGEVTGVLLEEIFLD